MRAVTFLRAWRVYQPGETAGFDDAMAAQIIEGGFAVPHDPDAAAPRRRARSAAAQPAPVEAHEAEPPVAEVPAAVAPTADEGQGQE